MACRIVWSQSAQDDLREIVRYIARDNREVAEKFGRFLISKVDSVANFPRIGRMVPEFRLDTLREVIVSPYRIIYTINADSTEIQVVRVWHSARNQPDLNG